VKTLVALYSVTHPQQLRRTAFNQIAAEQFSLNRRCRVIDTRSQYARRVPGHGFKRLTHCGQ
jgi:hypothetical protein